MDRLSRQLRDSLAESRDVLDKRVEKLTQTTETRLKEISGQVEKRLTEGFEKTTETFSRVLEHLGLQVSRLIRIQYGPFPLADIPRGMADEIRQGVDHLEDTIGTESFPQAMRDLLALARKAIETFNRREEAITGA
jgi:hypothetical protein